MSGSSNKIYREKSRMYNNSMRTSYLSLGSRRTLMRGFTRLSTSRTTFSNSYTDGNEMECKDILCKRGFFKRIFYNNFNKMFNKKIINSNNSCKKYGIILMILFLINLGSLIAVFVIKDPVVCRKELTGYKVGIEHVFHLEANDCNFSDNFTPKSLQNLIDFEKIYVYYEIYNYPFHYSNVYKLYSKSQLSGKISRSRSDLKHCDRYTKALINGVNRIINPCGSHVVNVYNDQFEFFKDSSKICKSNPNSSKKDNSKGPSDKTTPDQCPEELLELDESRELLSKNQEYENVENISKEDKLTFNDYYWLDDTIEYIKEVKIGLGRNFDLLNGWNRGNKIRDQLNSDKAGEGVKNGHFIQWLTAPPFPNFAKLYGVLKGPVNLPLNVRFKNNYDVNLFGGKKFLILKASLYNLGHLNILRILFSIFTLLSLVFSLIFFLYKPKNGNNILNLL